jgi:hypothetical protein
VQARERALVAGGLGEEHLHDAVRIAATAAVSLDMIPVDNDVQQQRNIAVASNQS